MSTPESAHTDDRVQIAFEVIGLVPVNGEHPDDFELSEADGERLKTCECLHCEPGDGICPMTVQALIGEYLSNRDDALAHALAPRLSPEQCPHHVDPHICRNGDCAACRMVPCPVCLPHEGGTS